VTAAAAAIGGPAIPAVGVITPCYNAARHVGPTIASVLGQTLQAFDYVIIDDGSTDGSVAAAGSAVGGDPRTRVCTTPNRGVAAARNRGFEAVDPSARYLLFLDADDVLEPDMLAVLVDHLDRHPSAGMAYCGFTLIDGAGRSFPQDRQALGWPDRFAPSRFGVRRLPPGQVQTPFEAVFTAPVLLPSTTLIRRSVYEQTPGFDESFGHLFEDADLFRQLALRADVHRLDRPLVRYRRHGSQSTANVEKVERQRAKLDRKWHDLPGLTDEQRRRVRAAEWFRVYRLAAYHGARAGLRHLRQGELRLAMRFLAGAARRYIESLFPRPDDVGLALRTS
jgi:glycosyltransferase involved in cell wall biosynthesis